MIIAPYDSDAQHLAKLRQRNVPTVIIDRRIEGWDVDRDEIEETVYKYCAELAPGGGYVLSSSDGIEEGILPENFGDDPNGAQVWSLRGSGGNA